MATLHVENPLLAGRCDELGLWECHITAKTQGQHGGQLDQAQLQYASEPLRSQQNLPVGAVAGLAGSAVGAGLWAGITVATGYQIGWMAVGVGFLAGFAVRTAGKGIDKIFGVVGAAPALLGCAAGNLLAACGLVARQENLAFFDVLSRLDASTAQQLMVATFTPIDLFFYGIAVYKVSSFHSGGSRERSSLGCFPGSEVCRLHRAVGGLVSR